NAGSDTVSVISSSGSVSNTITVGDDPVAVVAGFRGQVVAANNVSGSVSSSAPFPDSSAAAPSVTVGTGPDSLATNSRNIDSDVYVANGGSGTVSELNSYGSTVLDTYTVGGHPDGLAVNSSGDIYVGTADGNTVTELNSTGTVIDTITVGTNPDALAVNPTTGTVYAANAGSDTVSEISSSGTVIGTASVGGVPDGVAFNAVNGDVYVTVGSADTVDVLGG
ncbi:YncE family protein, partial [Mycobacterium sp. THU-M104]|uniref:YncE family protein n=1 Tax=Mycobacterium sp. THU-M104 TaxID=3410515 RepID=UPI003B9D181D